MDSTSKGIKRLAGYAMLIVAFVFAAALVNAGGITANAQVKNVSVANGSTATLGIHPGDTGRLIPTGMVTSADAEKEASNEGTASADATASSDASADASAEASTRGIISDGYAKVYHEYYVETYDLDTYYYDSVTKSYKLKSSYNVVDEFKYTTNNGSKYNYNEKYSSYDEYMEYYVDYDYDDPAYITLDSKGNYKATGKGTGYAYIFGYNKFGYKVFTGTVSYSVTFDMSKVTLGISQIKAYIVPSYVYGDSKLTRDYSMTYITVTIPLKKASKVYKYEDVSATCKSSKISSVYATMNYGIANTAKYNQITLIIGTYKAFNGKVKITLEGKTYVLPLKVKKVYLDTNSVTLVKGKSRALKLNRTLSDVTWKSSNEKIATVSKKGVIKTKAYGNCVITCKIAKGTYVGTTVSVVPKGIDKVVERAEYIGRNWTYSQPLRVNNGYYDCSALVWKSYKTIGQYFGNASYPGTTVTESLWCGNNKRLISGGFKYSMFNKMNLMPGDILFKADSSSGSYQSLAPKTYHVEMFTGYSCSFVDSRGKASIADRWGARGSGYISGFENGDMLGRPVKYTIVSNTKNMNKGSWY